MSEEGSGSSVCAGFYDILSKLLAWKSTSGSELPMAQRKKLPPAGQVQVATAENGEVHS